MRIWIPTLDLMLMLFNLLSLKYNTIIDINKRHIKFITTDNMKCCLRFSSQKDDLLHIDFIKQIRFIVSSKQFFVWSYNSGHPLLSKQSSYDYIADYVMTNITYYLHN